MRITRLIKLEKMLFQLTVLLLDVLKGIVGFEILIFMLQFLVKFAVKLYKRHCVSSVCVKYLSDEVIRNSSRILGITSMISFLTELQACLGCLLQLNCRSTFQILFLPFTI